MANQTLDVIDLTDHVNDAHSECYGVIQLLDMLRREENDNSALVAVLLKSLDGVYDTLGEMKGYLAAQAG